MYNEKCNIEVITVGENIIVYGLNLQSSGLPINFDSLGVMWDKYTEDMKNNTPNRADKEIEYAVCLNKVPDYIVGVETTEIQEEEAGFKSFTIPAGKYVKVEFNGENHQDLVDGKLMTRQKEAKKWAKDEKIKLSNEFTLEVYPKQTIDLEHPEMYCLFPIL
ncbi:MAG TPA: AraC family transcriptional regulator [Lachnoclostridium phytofermentans]|uniref:AraC family transcriptional regulator n=1 Tax=Lachnoclostridium phytofermentans TaxID=66219 RepID=A0A3D2X317_9FIRM|nr:effector binding domain-containing protein [Lachnoclostridium sp.]HCL01502.1 AraC family transcriptional regulator [Lachnoclostridium phytofermentans]